MSRTLKSKKGTKKSRPIDTLGESSYRQLGKKFSLVSNKRITTWKALSVVTFFSGLMAASIWFVSYRMENEALVIDPKLFSLAESEKDGELKKGGVVGRADDRILVKFRDNASSEKRQAVLEKHALKEDSEITKTGVKVMKLSPGKNPEEAVKKIKDEDSSNVEFAEVDALMEPSFVPNDPMYPNEWHLPKMGATSAWDSTKGASVTVAVLDSGVDCNHPDLASNCVSGWNMYSNNADTSDVHGHGTKVAGTVAAIGENALGVAGTAYRAKIMPIRISDTAGYAYWSTVASSITWAADHGAKVVTNSYSSSGSSAVQSAANYLKGKGGIFVASAGNEGALLGADVSSVITVGATGGTDAKASWSNYGPQIDVVAPGVGINTTVRGGGYGAASGTSFAAPNTAAVLALLFSQKPSLSPAQAEQILESSAVDLGTAGKDDTFGNGRIDAAAALTLASGTTTSDTAAPSAPANLKAVVNGTSVELSWSASIDNVGVVKYVIYRGGVEIATSSGTSHTDSNPVMETSNSYTVKAVDAAGNFSPASNTVSATPTNAFTISDVIGGAKTATTATITWSTSFPSKGGIKYGLSPTALTSTVSESQEASSHSLTLSGLTKKTRYYYQIFSLAPNGQTVTSQVFNVLTKPR